MGYAPGAAFGQKLWAKARTAGIARPLKKKSMARRSLASHRSAKPEPRRQMTSCAKPALHRFDCDVRFIAITVRQNRI